MRGKKDEEKRRKKENVLRMRGQRGASRMK